MTPARRTAFILEYGLLLTLYIPWRIVFGAFLALLLEPGRPTVPPS
jgi:hypothetical protein